MYIVYINIIIKIIVVQCLPVTEGQRKRFDFESQDLGAHDCTPIDKVRGRWCTILLHTATDQLKAQFVVL